MASARVGTAAQLLDALMSGARGIRLAVGNTLEDLTVLCPTLISRSSTAAPSATSGRVARYPRRGAGAGDRLPHRTVQAFYHRRPDRREGRSAREGRPAAPLRGRFRGCPRVRRGADLRSVAVSAAHGCPLVEVGS
jgi:hypothetical protein